MKSKRLQAFQCFFFGGGGGGDVEEKCIMQIRYFLCVFYFTFR